MLLDFASRLPWPLLSPEGFTWRFAARERKQLRDVDPTNRLLMAVETSQWLWPFVLVDPHCVINRGFAQTSQAFEHEKLPAHSANEKTWKDYKDLQGLDKNRWSHFWVLKNGMQIGHGQSRLVPRPWFMSGSSETASQAAGGAMALP